MGIVSVMDDDITLLGLDYVLYVGEWLATSPFPAPLASYVTSSTVVVPDQWRYGSRRLVNSDITSSVLDNVVEGF